jgi:hypothetical protein
MSARAGTLAALALLALPPAAALARTHRLHVPGPVLAHGLTVDELEWTLRPSKRVVAAGPVRIRVYNRGEDDHDLVVVDRAGGAHVVTLKPGTSDLMTPRLAPGRYRLFCSLQAGTPESHEARGMWFELEVR